MKNIIKITLLFLMTLAVSESMYACDICGGGSDNSFGLLPAFNRHFVGLRYQFREFRINHPTLFASEESIEAKAYYQQAEIWGRAGFLKNRLFLMGSLPFVYNVQEESGQRYLSTGLGDAQLQLQGLVFNSSDGDDYKIRHSLFVGAGIKLPSGAYRNSSPAGKLLPAGIQPGSGSVDIPLNMLYTLMYRRFGINAELHYRINTTSPAGYKNGNRFMSTMQFLYRREWRSAILMPYASFGFENRALDTRDGFVQEFTGGNVLNAGIGMECFMKKTAFGFAVSHPLYQRMGSGYVNAGFQAQARFLFII